MSIQIKTADGRKVYDDDLAVAISEAKRLGNEVPFAAVLDHLELIGQVPEMFGESTAFAARAALKLLSEYVDVDVLSTSSTVPTGI